MWLQEALSRVFSWRGGGEIHASYLAPEPDRKWYHTAFKLQKNLIYLKPNALHLKLSWEKKVNVNTILVKKVPDILH